MGFRAIVTLASPPSAEAEHHHQLHHHHPLHSHHQHFFRPTRFIIYIGVAVAIVVVLLVTAIVFFFSSRRHKSTKSIRSKASTVSQRYGGFSHRNMSNNASPDMANCLYMGIVGPPSLSKFRGGQVFTYKELEVATDSFNPENVIGNGGFGLVYRGVLSDGTVAAIKMLNREGKQGEREFRVEVDLLSRLHSPYLVQLLGYCADQHHRLLVFEFMPNGSLQNHLHPSNKKYQLLNWGTRLRIALDCAKGLEFLHEHSNQPVIHRDFKCSNILLDHNFRAKVSDFGLAKMGSDKINGQVTTRVLGTTGYVAPEYASSGKVTTKSDVYCYGVVLLELITGRVPVDSRRPPGEQVLVSWALPRLTNREKVMEMVDPVLDGQFSKKELIQVAAIAAVCVQSEADYRPFMTDVVQSLIPLVKSLSTSVPSTPYKFQHRKVPSVS
ncbi:hypothetical protein H6P81_001928 [Aristolochia fimbriata]|uniref:Protein kinase domain-containing protein n=1 Tax=Aristolochia fimbriata TaxID=158543 RepID=A0AAV7FB31_ARIFI|nr:hypothetical protein H6P81_001928 [Aristolochia fimbriata]